MRLKDAPQHSGSFSAFKERRNPFAGIKFSGSTNKFAAAIFIIAILISLIGAGAGSSTKVETREIAEPIKKFSVQLVRRADGTLTIAENIVALSKGLELKTGFKRKFPETLEIGDDFLIRPNYSIGFVGLDSQQLAITAPTKLSNEWEYKIGGNTPLSIGEHSFLISYDVSGLLYEFGEGSAREGFAWELNRGLMWPPEIMNVEVELPPGLSVIQLRVSAEISPELAAQSKRPVSQEIRTELIELDDTAAGNKRYQVKFERAPSFDEIYKLQVSWRVRD